MTQAPPRGNRARLGTRSQVWPDPRRGGREPLRPSLGWRGEGGWCEDRSRAGVLPPNEFHVPLDFAHKAQAQRWGCYDLLQESDLRRLQSTEPTGRHCPQSHSNALLCPKGHFSLPPNPLSSLLSLLFSILVALEIMFRLEIILLGNSCFYTTSIPVNYMRIPYPFPVVFFQVSDSM